MHQRHRREVALVDWIDQIRDARGNQPFERLELPAQSDNKAEREVDYRQHQKRPRLQDWPQLRRPLVGAPGADHEQELPCEWVEIELSAWPRRHMPA